jgi:hypothetical protein
MRKSNSSVFSLIIAFLCIAVYAAALIIGAYRLYVNVSDRRVIAEREFYDLADLASAAGVLGFMDTPFQEAIRDGLAKSRTLEGVIISGPSGEYAFERERGAVIQWEGDSPRFTRRLGVSATSAVPLRINGLRNVNISAGFSAVDYDYGITILKHSLIVILAALATAFLTLLIESALSKDQASAGRGTRRDNRSSEYDEEEPEDELEDPVPGHGAQKTGSRETPQAWAQEPVDSEFPDSEPFDSQSFVPESPASDSKTSTLGIFDSELPDFSDLADFEPQPDFVPPIGGVSEEFELPEADLPGENYTGDEDQADVPRGLYSPRSNVGWEDYTKDRLESELHRCASFEQDLVLMVIAFSDKTSATDEQYKQFADMAVSFFNLRDLIFENGDRGITVILPNTDLDQGFTRAEDFHNHLTATFTAVAEFRIGISARSSRLVDAERLFFEASEALNKAYADPVSPVIAFKSDPEKYRAFLRSRR